MSLCSKLDLKQVRRAGLILAKFILQLNWSNEFQLYFSLFCMPCMLISRMLCTWAQVVTLGCAVATGGNGWPWMLCML
jgi:hypothetical protein